MSTGLTQKRILALLARVAIIVFAVAMALDQIGVANDIVNMAFGLILAGAALAAALAFGLGGAGRRQVPVGADVQERRRPPGDRAGARGRARRGHAHGRQPAA